MKKVTFHFVDGKSVTVTFNSLAAFDRMKDASVLRKDVYCGDMWINMQNVTYWEVK